MHVFTFVCVCSKTKKKMDLLGSRFTMDDLQATSRHSSVSSPVYEPQDLPPHAKNVAKKPALSSTKASQQDEEFDDISDGDASPPPLPPRSNPKQSKPATSQNIDSVSEKVKPARARDAETKKEQDTKIKKRKQQDEEANDHPQTTKRNKESVFPENREKITKYNQKQDTKPAVESKAVASKTSVKSSLKDTKDEDSLHEDDAVSDDEKQRITKTTPQRAQVPRKLSTVTSSDKRQQLSQETQLEAEETRNEVTNLPTRIANAKFTNDDLSAKQDDKDNDSKPRKSKPISVAKPIDDSFLTQTQDNQEELAKPRKRAPRPKNIDEGLDATQDEEELEKAKPTQRKRADTKSTSEPVLTQTQEEQEYDGTKTKLTQRKRSTKSQEQKENATDTMKRLKDLGELYRQLSEDVKLIPEINAQRKQMFAKLRQFLDKVDSPNTST